MKRKQKRWISVAQIEIEIDEARDEITLIQKQSPGLEERIKGLDRWIYDWKQEHDGNSTEDQKDEFSLKWKLRESLKKELSKLKARNKSLEGRLLLLKQKLAIAKTEVFPFMPDKSVV